MKSISARAYENDNYWLIDLIDLFRGKGYCEKKWEEEYSPPKDDKKIKKFWRK